jgi:glycine cleavage system H protein
MKRFTNFHEWIDLTTGQVGITSYGKQELGDIVYVELPKTGQIVRSGEAVCVVESTKAATDVHSPVSGHVAEVNDLLAKDPSLLNRDHSWLYKVDLSDPTELDRLMDQVEYDKFISGK